MELFAKLTLAEREELAGRLVDAVARLDAEAELLRGDEDLADGLLAAFGLKPGAYLAWGEAAAEAAGLIIDLARSPRLALVSA